MQFCSITITEVYSGALNSSVLTLSSDILYKTDWIAKVWSSNLLHPFVLVPTKIP